MKTLNVVEVLNTILKLVLLAVGGVTASDATVLHLNTETLGAIVSGATAASLGLSKLRSVLQLRIEPVDPKKLNQ